MPLNIRYNSPVVLTFTLVAALIHVWSGIDGQFVDKYLAAPAYFNYRELGHYTGVLGHIFGHVDLNHLRNNFLLILLVGPLLEERHGSVRLLQMIIITALATGITNALFFDTRLIGASGIAFMMILLASFSNFNRGEIPLTFILIAVLFLGREVTQSLQADKISQFSHLLGGFFGACFGFFGRKPGQE